LASALYSPTVEALRTFSRRAADAPVFVASAAMQMRVPPGTRFSHCFHALIAAVLVVLLVEAAIDALVSDALPTTAAATLGRASMTDAAAGPGVGACGGAKGLLGPCCVSRIASRSWSIASSRRVVRLVMGSVRRRYSSTVPGMFAKSARTPLS
jgi:hypothetical protein